MAATGPAGLPRPPAASTASGASTPHPTIVHRTAHLPRTPSQTASTTGAPAFDATMLDNLRVLRKPTAKDGGFQNLLDLQHAPEMRVWDKG